MSNYISSPPQTANTADYSGNAGTGCVSRPIYHTRMTKAYLIYDAEFGQLGAMNILSTVFFSFALASWTTAIGIYVSFINYDHLNPKSEVIMEFGPPCLGVLGGLFLAVTIWAYIKSYGIVKRVKSESVEVKT